MSKLYGSFPVSKALVVTALSVLFVLRATAQYGSDQWWIAPADLNVYRGSVSLEVHNERANYTGLSLAKGTTYSLSYWVKTDAKTGVGVTFGTTVQGSGTFNDESACVTDGGYLGSTSTDTNWHQYFATITPTNTSTNFEFGIDCRPTSKMWWIDQVRLVVAGSAAPIVNLIQDPGFEMAFVTNINNDDTDWPTEGWIDAHWTSEYNWDIFTYNDPTGPTALTIEGSEPIVHSGYASLLVNNERANFTQLSLSNGVTYNLTYWALAYPGDQIGVGGFGTDVPGVYPAIQTNEGACITAGGYQAYDMTNAGWTEFTATITPTNTATDFEFGIDSRPGPTYIDDVVLVAAGTTNNLVNDPGFERAYQNTFMGPNTSLSSLGFAPQDGWPTAGWIDNDWYSEYNWDTFKYGNATGPEALSIEGVPAVVHSGNAALEVDYQSPRANYTGLSLTQGTTYTLTYWVESTETNVPVGVTFGTYSGNGTINDESACVTAGGYASSSTPSDPTISGWATAPWAIWSNYSATITPTNTATNFEFGIDCRPVASDFYIDDVVLVAQGSTVNLVQDGGFESAFQSDIGGDGNDWFTANWVDQHWFSEYAFQVHEYGNPAGPQSLYIQGTPAVAATVTLPTRPTLGIAVATNTVTISWPLASVGYVLQYNADITTTNWVNVTTTASTNASSFWISVPVRAGNAFYRLAN